MATTIYKICKRTIERELAKGPLSQQFITDMTTKLDIYSAANKITAAEYSELISMMQ